jgi:hypothetical protein
MPFSAAPPTAFRLTKVIGQSENESESREGSAAARKGQIADYTSRYVLYYLCSYMTPENIIQFCLF